VSDPLARRLASGALAVSLVALVVAIWAVRLGYRYLDDVQRVGETMETLMAQPARSAPLEPPPLMLDTGEE